MFSTALAVVSDYVLDFCLKRDFDDSSCSKTKEVFLTMINGGTRDIIAASLDPGPLSYVRIRYRMPRKTEEAREGLDHYDLNTVNVV